MFFFLSKIQIQQYFTELGYYEYFSHVKEYAVQPFNLHRDWEKYPKEFRTFHRKMVKLNQKIPLELQPNIGEDAPQETLPMS